MLLAPAPAHIARTETDPDYVMRPVALDASMVSDLDPRYTVHDKGNFVDGDLATYADASLYAAGQGLAVDVGRTVDVARVRLASNTYFGLSGASLQTGGQLLINNTGGALRLQERNFAPGELSAQRFEVWEYIRTRLHVFALWEWVHVNATT